MTRPVTWHNPYRLEYSSLLFRLHRASFSGSDRLRWRLLRYPFFSLFSYAYRCGFQGTIRLNLRVRGKETAIALRTRNLQFSSLYLPQHAAGYEPETAALLDVLVAPDGVFYDVGSNWGYYALWLAGREGFHGKAHAFEPEPSSLEDLRAAVAQAGLEGTVACHGLGLSDSAGTGRLAIPDGMHSGTATISPAGGQEVRLAKLDDLGIDPPTVIKLDVEGQEEQVLRGAAKTLEAHRPHIVFESWARPDQLAATTGILQALRGLRYRFFHPAWAVRKGGSVSYAQSAALSEGAVLELALVPFAPEQRSLLREHLNVFACHEDRLPMLEGMFRS
ncbi:MAG: FkbM family methyltransferase [Elusimicrobia bacterium]|nr:FkbM family methyltransferase [Elusimicrobiota bacterium]